MNPELDKKLVSILDGCLKGDQQSQKKLYQHFYGYALSICLRYTANKTEAIEVLNEGYLKVFTKLKLYDRNISLKGWIRRIMINSAIDFYRQHQRHISTSKHLENVQEVSAQETTISKLTYDEIIAEIQKLTPAYRTIFYLYVVDGFTHEEIAEKLDISVGTSKSNLSRARAILQKRLAKIYTNGRAPKSRE